MLRSAADAFTVMPRRSNHGGTRMPDASIIIAAWNAQHTIRTAIDSALCQIGVTVEVIVADDASTDATANIVQSIQDQRLRLVRNESNGGPAAARNAAIAAATGDWIVVLDADDTMQAGRLAALLGKAAAHHLDIVADNMWVGESDGRRRLFIQESLDDTLEHVTFSKYCAYNALFGSLPSYGYLKPAIRAAFLHATALRYDEALRVGEDFDFVAAALALGGRFGRVRNAYYNYTVAAGSISHILSLRDARAMCAADDRFLVRFARSLTAGERRALLAHRRSLRDGGAFISLVDQIKSRDLGGAVRTALGTPAALRLLSLPLKARLARLRQKPARQLRAHEPLADASEAGRA
jgi:succinoglycan biosynthesis protein ExoO